MELVLLLTTGVSAAEDTCGPRTFGPGNSYHIQTQLPARLLVILSDDYDQDGNLDLVSGSWETNHVLVFWGDGIGGFSASDSYRAPGTTVDLTVADLDKDGHLDLVVCSYDGPEGVALYWGNGDRTFTEGELLPTEGNHRGSRYVIAADFDHDGDLDIAATQSEADTIMIMENLSCRGPLFVRGDSNADGTIHQADAVDLLSAIFGNPAGPSCDSAADANDDGTVNIADAIYVLSYLFKGTAAPPPPFAACGTDPTADTLECAAFPRCAR